MNCEIICIGTEILLGDILNTNAQFLSKELAKHGINLYYQTVVGDNPKRIKECLEIALNRVDLIITTGGLGPTKDDITKEIIAEMLEEELILDNESKELLIHRLKSVFHQTDISSTNLKQAYIPKNAKALPNHNGTAPGILLEKSNKSIIMLPGPPSELKPMFLEYVSPFLKSKSSDVIISETLIIKNYQEDLTARLLCELLENDNPTIATYAKENCIEVRVTAKAKNEFEAQALIKPIIIEINKRLNIK